MSQTADPNVEAIAKASSTSVVVGILIGLQEQDQERTPIVVYPGQSQEAGIAARSTVELGRRHIGREVLLTFEAGNPRSPIVIGCMQRSTDRARTKPDVNAEIEIDGERVLVAARETLVLRCGAASITLTRAGKILISGNYVSHRSTGVVRIKGGAIQLN